MPDIFDEIADDLRAERTHSLLRRYGAVLAAVVVLVLVAAGGFEAWKKYSSGQSEKYATTYFDAQTVADGPLPGRTAALPALTALSGDAGPGYRTLARLRAASIDADSGQLPAALVAWDQIAADGGADPILRDFANLQWALHQIDAGDPALVSARLLPLTGEGGAWRTLAQEGQALLAIRQGQTDVARDTLRKLAADTAAPDGVRGRANGLLQRVGG